MPQSLLDPSASQQRPNSAQRKLAKYLRDRYGDTYAQEQLFQWTDRPASTAPAVRQHDRRESGPSLPAADGTTIARPSNSTPVNTRDSEALPHHRSLVDVDAAVAAVEARRGPTRPSLLPEGPDALGELSKRLTAPVEDGLPAGIFRTYRALHRLALEVAARRQYTSAVSCVTFHLPTEMVAHALGISRTTLWGHRKMLKKAGLIDSKGHMTKVHGKRVKDGTVWSVKLHPRRGKSARLRYEELAHKWRDLEADIQEGRTAFNWIEQSKPKKEEASLRFGVLLAWALAPGRFQTPSSMTVQPAATPELASLLNVGSVPKEERNSAVDGAARAVATHLGDSSLDFYRWLIWQLLRRRDQGEDRFPAIYNMVIRVGAERAEGFAKQAGALLASRLKAQGLWEWLRQTPNLRVGQVPA